MQDLRLTLRIKRLRDYSEASLGRQMSHSLLWPFRIKVVTSARAIL